MILSSDPWSLVEEEADLVEQETWELRSHLLETLAMMIVDPRIKSYLLTSYISNNLLPLQWTVETGG